MSVLNRSKNTELKHTENDTHKYLTFLLAGESYAFSILRVKEIIEYGEVTALPLMPDFICGAINLRGKVVPVIDLAGRLGLKSADISRRTCIIITELKIEDKLINTGLIIDSVSRVVDLNSDQIEATPALGSGIRTDFIEAMGKVDDQFVILLNIDNVMSNKDLSKLSQVNGDIQISEAATDTAKPKQAVLEDEMLQSGDKAEQVSDVITEVNQKISSSKNPDED
ncbi:MAG: chemotaxis protein CheW [Gammaproteobacteria bacterium]|nr:chemotaxis protein CheW [Gammaproteobacteria bacterium]